MAKCKTCGKPIPDSLTYCSSECAEADRTKTATTTTTTKATPTVPVEVPFATQFDKGHGSVRREANIRKVMQMLKDGIPEEEIRFQLSILFRDMTVDSYIRTAKEWLKREAKNEPH